MTPWYALLLELLNDFRYNVLLEFINKSLERFWIMIYFDNSATTKPNTQVLEAYQKVALQYFGNASSIHHLGMEAEKLFMQARKQIATLLNVKSSEIIFTSGGTEGNNFAIKGIAKQFSSRGRHIITSSIEHPSVYETCEQLKNEGFEITYLPVDHEGRISLHDLKNAMRNDTILVSIMHTNNEVGTIQPIKEIGEIVNQFPKAFFHVDYVQGAGKIPLNFYESHIDLATISGHKFHGLKGTGALYIREGTKIQPLLAGGGQEFGLRSGTENVAGMVAMAKALRLSIENFTKSKENLMHIKKYLFEQLKMIQGVRINTPVEGSAPHIINFSVEGYKAEVLVHAIAKHEIYVSTTSACSSKLGEPSKTLVAMGLPANCTSSSIRISLSYENTMEEAKQAIQVIKQCIEQLKFAMRGS